MENILSSASESTYITKIHELWLFSIPALPCFCPSWHHTTCFCAIKHPSCTFPMGLVYYDTLKSPRTFAAFLPPFQHRTWVTWIKAAVLANEYKNSKSHQVILPVVKIWKRGRKESALCSLSYFWPPVPGLLQLIC